MSFSSCDIKSGGIFRLVSHDTKAEVKLVSINFVTFSRAIETLTRCGCQMIGAAVC